MNREHYHFIKKQALAKSSATGDLVTANDLMRDALEKAFPAPKQFDMFGGKKC